MAKEIVLVDKPTFRKLASIERGGRVLIREHECFEGVWRHDSYFDIAMSLGEMRKIIAAADGVEDEVKY